MERGDLSHRDDIIYQTVSRLLVANHVFLGSGLVDSCQDGHSLSSAPQRHMVHLRQHSHFTCRKPRGWDQGDAKMHCPPGESALAKHLVS